MAGRKRQPERQPRRRARAPRQVNGSGAALVPPPRVATSKEIVATTRRMVKHEIRATRLRRELRKAEEAIRATKREINQLTTIVELPLGAAAGAGRDDVIDPRD